MKPKSDFIEQIDLIINNLKYLRLKKQGFLLFSDDKNTLFGIKDLKGKIILPCIYTYVFEQKNGFFYAQQFEERFWINKDGIRINIYTL